MSSTMSQWMQDASSPRPAPPSPRISTAEALAIIAAKGSAEKPIPSRPTWLAGIGREATPEEDDLLDVLDLHAFIASACYVKGPLRFICSPQTALLLNATTMSGRIFGASVIADPAMTGDEILSLWEPEVAEALRGVIAGRQEA